MKVIIVGGVAGGATAAARSAVLLDVRTVGEFNRGHMDGFKNIPVDELRERINEVEKEMDMKHSTFPVDSASMMQ